MKIVTDSRAPEEPKDPESDNLFRIFEHFGSPDAVASVRSRYESGGIGYGEVKTMLAEALEERFAEPLARYEELMADRSRIDELLAAGAARAGTVADDVLGRVRKAVGFKA